jgi:hypothetical protein
MEDIQNLLARLDVFERDEAAWLPLDRDLYPDSAIGATAEALAASCAVDFFRADGRYAIRLTVLPAHQHQRSQIVRNFLSHALCEAVHVRRPSRT